LGALLAAKAAAGVTVRILLNGTTPSLTPWRANRAVVKQLLAHPALAGIVEVRAGVESGNAASEALVRRSGARFLFSDCHGRPDLTRRFAGFTEAPRRFGCATVWRVRG
jgi:hypothetical protein